MANRLMNNTMVSEKKKSLTNEKSNFFDRYGINGGGGESNLLTLG